MKFVDWRWITGLPKLLTTPRPEPTRQAERIAAAQLHIVLPAKAGIVVVALYYLFFSNGFYQEETARSVLVDTLRNYFLIYLGCNAVGWVLLSFWRRLPGAIQWVAFTLGLLDGLFVAGLTLLTGGFGSIAFWIFPGLIVLNAFSIPLAMPQLVLNILLSFVYLGAGILNAQIGDEIILLYMPKSNPVRRVETTAEMSGTNSVAINGTNAVVSTQHSSQGLKNRRRPLWDPSTGLSDENSQEPVLLQLFVLWLMTICCYGVQVLTERQRRALEEEREFAVLEGELRSAGRLAAEFAHQIKNPLAIINNTAYSMQRALKDGRNDIARQIAIVQEEVARSDRIVTEILGYAQLNEGRIEKLNVTDELERAITQVFPAGAGYRVQIERRYGSAIPPLLMQRRHLGDIFVNLLQNAREALSEKGKVWVSAELNRDSSVEIVIGDNGPGIPTEKRERVFEPYYTTREKGTGLGLAIVKHNVELYSGSIRVESELGKGARFILRFPARTVTFLQMR